MVLPPSAILATSWLTKQSVCWADLKCSIRHQNYALSQKICMLQNAYDLMLGRHGQEEPDHHLCLGPRQQPVLVLQQDNVQKIINLASTLTLFIYIAVTNPFSILT